MVKVPSATVEAPGIDVLPYLLLPLAGPEEFDLEVSEGLPYLPLCPSYNTLHHLGPRETPGRPPTPPSYQNQGARFRSPTNARGDTPPAMPHTLGP